MKQASAKLLVLMTSPLDMMAHGLRVVASFKAQLPNLEVTWVARRLYAPVVSAFECVDHTIAFHRRGGLPSAVALAREIRRERYDFVFDFEGHARTGAMCWVARSRRKIGRSDAREGATVCYREVVGPPSNGSEHALESMLEFGRALGLSASLEGSLRTRENIEPIAQWRDAGIRGVKRICLFPERYKESRAWPKMLEFGQTLAAEREDIRVFLVGASRLPRDRFEGDRLIDLRGVASWPQICAMLSEADLTVANDNGPSQLAGALGRANLTLYSYVLPERRGSYPLSAAWNSRIVSPRGDVAQLDLRQVKAAAEKLLDA